ncbi:GntR family transcriptional regulator [Vibrio sp.]|nr:GntR family transcriptional regulator [Vibrio sp.]
MKGTKTNRLVDALKQWITTHNLQPGDRLPSEVELIKKFQASKSTVREGIRALDAQGLIVTKTGPKGGIFVSEMNEVKAKSLLSNYLFFKDVSISDLYQMRIALEPELAYSLAGELSTEQINQLINQVHKYATPPVGVVDEQDHHIDSIAFHTLLAGFSSNELLKFNIRFIAQMLTDITISKKLYERENYELWKTGYESHRLLINALLLGDKDKAKNIMRKHMLNAHDYMKSQEATVSQKLFSEIIA